MVEFFIAPDGNDTNPGTLEHPFATLERARDVVRATAKHCGATVWLRGGTYERQGTFELNEQDGGQPGVPVVYQAYGREEVRITGGCRLDVSLAKRVEDLDVRNRIIEEAARAKVMRVDLKGTGITDYGVMRPRGFRRPYVPAPMEVFINDEALHLARWPNDGVVPIGRIVDPGSNPREGDFSNRGGTFTFEYDRPRYWTKAKDLWLSGLFAYGYADDTIQVASIDLDKKTLTMVQPHMYGLMSGRPFHGYYALNALEEIDQPGEYCIDRERGILYFYPPVSLENARITVSLMEEPLVAMEGASYITFKDLMFEDTRGMGIYIERGGHNRISHCTLRNIGMVAVCVGKGIEPDPIYRHSTTGKPVSRQLGSWHEHIYDHTTLDRQAGVDQGVEGCHIYNIGAGGVSLGGGDRKTLTPAGNYVQDCRIHQFNRLDRSYKAAVNIDGVGNRVSRCVIHDCPNNAIYLHGNDHVIEMNEVHHACTDADDMGVFYMGRDPSEQGNIIANNYFHDNGCDHGSTSVLYFDDDACGVTVTGNIIAKNKGAAVWVNRGCNHVFDNNLFVDNRDAIPAGADERNYNWKTDALQDKRLRIDLDITQPPYSTRYPKLPAAYNTPKGQGLGNEVTRNVSVRSGAFGTGTNTLKDNWCTDADPGFVDAAHGDYRLQDTSPVYRHVPGFKNRSVGN
jgi:hypothetical protein